MPKFKDRNGFYQREFQGRGPLPPLKSGFVVELDDCFHCNLPNTFRRAPCKTEEEAVKQAEKMADRMEELEKRGELRGGYTNRLIVIRRLADDARRAVLYFGYGGGRPKAQKQSIEGLDKNHLWKLADYMDHTVKGRCFVRGEERDP